jgi:hypothetical protein
VSAPRPTHCTVTIGSPNSRRGEFELPITIQVVPFQVTHLVPF